MTSFRWTIVSAVLTPILALICIFLMGGGHGWCTPTILLFPLAMIPALWQDELSVPFMIAGLFQFIIYGLLIDRAKGKEYQDTVAIEILVFHLILVGVVISLSTW